LAKKKEQSTPTPILEIPIKCQAIRHPESRKRWLRRFMSNPMRIIEKLAPVEMIPEAIPLFSEVNHAASRPIMGI
jgi:hypothetical protein